MNEYEPGRAQKSFDKQFVREYLESIGWDKKPPARLFLMMWLRIRSLSTLKLMNELQATSCVT